MARARKASARTPQEGMTLLLAPDHVSAASAGGVEYAVGDDGLIEVPTGVMVELLDHGFTIASLPSSLDEA